MLSSGSAGTQLSSERPCSGRWSLAALRSEPASVGHTSWPPLQPSNSAVPSPTGPDPAAGASDPVVSSPGPLGGQATHRELAGIVRGGLLGRGIRRLRIGRAMGPRESQAHLDRHLSERS
jgi:hypothetical protein